jgi:hypothetical protein
VIAAARALGSTAAAPRLAIRGRAALDLVAAGIVGDGCRVDG